MIEIHLVFHTYSFGILLPLGYARAPLNSPEDRHCLGHWEESKPPTCQGSCPSASAWGGQIQPTKGCGVRRSISSYALERCFNLPGTQVSPFGKRRK